MSLVPWYAGIAIAQAAVGLWVLSANPRRLLNWSVGALLLLWAASGVLFQFMREATDPAAWVFYARTATYYEFPAFLLALFIADQVAARQPRPRWRQALLGAAVLLGVAFGLWHAVTPTTAPLVTADGALRFVTGSPADVLGAGLRGLATTLAFIATVFLAARFAASEEHPVLRRRQAALVGLAFALLLAQNVGGGWVWDLRGQGLSRDPLGLVRDVVGRAAVVPLAYALWALPRPFEGSARPAVAAAVVLALAAGALGQAFNLNSAYGTRVIVVTGFALALAVAVLRYDLGGHGVAHRRREAAAGAVLAFGAVAVVAGAALSLTGPTSLGVGVLGLAVLVPIGLLAVPLRGAPSWLSRQVFLDPRDPAVLRERVRVYAATLEAALGADGHLPAASEPALRALRQQLGISDRDHVLLLAEAAERPERRRLVTYRLALEEAGPDPQGEDAERLRRVRAELGVTEEEHALLAADVAAPAKDGLGPLRPGQRILGRYRVLRPLGRGAFGEVLLARDEARERDVVLKRLVGERARDAHALRQFRREMRLAGALRHPRVVAIYDVARAGEEAYLVMEHLAGGSLADRLRERGPLREPEAVRVGLDVLEALQALHRRGIVHRDVKPANILLDAQGRAKLGDFSIAREVVSGETLGGGPVGTPAYMSPEQARGLPATPRSDLYAVAATLYEALTGKPPVEVEGLGAYEATLRVVQAPPALPAVGASPPVAAVLARALAKDPGERFPNAEAMARALRAAAGRGA